MSSPVNGATPGTTPGAAVGGPTSPPTGAPDLSRQGLGARPADHPAPGRAAVGPLALWFGLCGGAFAWSVLSIVNYSVAAQVCYPRMQPLAAPTIGSGRLTAILLTVAAAAIILSMAAGIVALRNWERTRQEVTGGAHWALDTGEGRTRFMALSSLMTSSVFILAILVHAITIVTVSPCW